MDPTHNLRIVRPSLPTPLQTAPTLEDSALDQPSERDLSDFETGGVYLLDISVRGGSGQKSLPYEVMGLTRKQAKKLKVSPPTITVFPDIDKCTNRCHGTVNKIRRYLITFPPFKYFHSSDLRHVQPLIQELYEREQEAKAFIEATYEQNRASYGDRLRHTLEDYVRAYGDRIRMDIDEVVEAYSRRFPSLEYAQRNFRVFIKGPSYVPSLEEQAQYNAAIASSRLQTQEAEAIQKLQEKYVRDIKDAMREAVRATRLEVINRLNDLVPKIKELKARGRAQAIQTELDSIYERLATLIKFDKDLKLCELRDAAAATCVLLDMRQTDLFQERLQDLEASVRAVEDELEEGFDPGAADLVL